MALVEKPAAAEEEVSDAPNPLEQPGFHVVVDGTHIGTYETAEDRDAFVAGHLTPNKVKPKLVDGPAAE